MKSFFKKNKYCVVRNALSKELTEYICDYIISKRNVAKILFLRNYISSHENLYGVFGDSQVPKSYAIYGDVAMDLLLLKLKKQVEKNIGKKVFPTYSYARVYQKGDVLKKHTDRLSCEISATLNLGGSIWALYVNSLGKKTKIDLLPGDMMIYRGEELEHWREPLKGETCSQVFLHFNDIKNTEAKTNLYDDRPLLGLPKDI
tara:strand:- start:3099 stop:3704 length:606 start_codon:yes stop_codon:yes gene_type:complete